MVVSAIELYEIPSAKLGKQEANALAEFVETKVEKQLIDKRSVFATKEDLAKEISSVRLEIRDAEVRLSRNTYIVGVLQFLAIAGRVLLLKFHIS